MVEAEPRLKGFRRTPPAEAIPWVVATQIFEEKAPFGVMEDGRVLQLDREHPPLLPTIGLVPTESFDEKRDLVRGFKTDFNPAAVGKQHTGLELDLNHPYPALGLALTTSSDGEGNLVRDLKADVEPNALDQQYNGLWVLSSDIIDLHEPWIRGDPEINVHALHGSTSQPARTATSPTALTRTGTSTGTRSWWARLGSSRTRTSSSPCTRTMTPTA